eukprot:gnl/TRDRNA2_/TRDRNA2_76644_c0_seq1.p1 gnl/TRDRNA2_/TRDRNA2_76644_c0~~gnl/TRDRNA2_/TRDRNA2_76644_c0_seq1.p1  ORF type:complete len:312 (-),score=55.72 gnl/TRDRNA2_/TRDRNA2_76644_c0_seq1:67-1002(-)
MPRERPGKPVTLTHFQAAPLLQSVVSPTFKLLHEWVIHPQMCVETMTVSGVADANVDMNGAVRLSHFRGKSGVEVDLFSQFIGAEGARVVSESLQHDSWVTRLHLKQTHLCDSGAEMLASCMPRWRGIKELTLSYNSIGDKGATVLAEALEGNQALETLTLANNAIGSKGAGRLAMSLTKNRTLTELNLNVNAVGDEGVDKFSDALDMGSKLVTLHLSGNRISDNSATVLITSAQRSSALLTLYLGGKHGTVEPKANTDAAPPKPECYRGRDVENVDDGQPFSLRFTEGSVQLTANKQAQMSFKHGASHTV